MCAYVCAGLPCRPDQSPALDLHHWRHPHPLVLLVLWPALSLPAGVFSQGYFTMWVVVSSLC